MGLDTLLNQMQNREPVTPCHPGGVPAKPAPDKAWTPVTPVTPKIINGESANETPIRSTEKHISGKTQDIEDWENLISWWLDHIGEHDPELRNVCLNQCRRDAEARRYFLSHAILEFREVSSV